MSVEIPAVPRVSTVDQLTTHLNDRLRRISLGLGPGAQGPPGKPGPPGPGGGGSSTIQPSVRGTPVTPYPGSQTLDDFAGNHVSVKMFGALGNGTVDETVAFTMAMAVATNLGLQLLVPAGTYNVRALTITQSLQMIGEGQNQTIIQYTGSSSIASVVTIDGSGNSPADVVAVRLENLQISGNAHSANALKLINCDRSVFRNLALRNCTGAALFCHFVVASEFDNIAVSNEFGVGYTQIPQYGLWAEDIFATNVITNIRVDGVTGDAIHLGTGASADIAFNLFQGALLEANGNGLVTESDATDNEFHSFDCEVNSTANFDISGFRNVLVNPLSGDGGAPVAGSWFYIRGGDNMVIGGQIGKYEIFSGVTGTIVLGVSYQLPSAVFDPSVTYAANVIVESSGVWYISLAGSNVGHTPVSSPAWWSPNPVMQVDNGTSTQWVYNKNISNSRAIDNGRTVGQTFSGDVVVSEPGGGIYSALRINSPAWGALLLLYSGLTGNFQHILYGCAAGTQGLVISEITTGADPTTGLPSATAVLQIVGRVIGLGPGLTGGPNGAATVHVQDASTRPTRTILQATASQSTQPVLEVDDASLVQKFTVDVSGNVNAVGHLASTGAFGVNGATPQTPAASGGAISPTATQTTPWGFGSSADFNALVALVNAIRTALVNNGIMS